MAKTLKLIFPRPAFSHDSDAEGYLPDRYLISFEHANASEESRVTIRNSASGVVHTGNITIPTLNSAHSPRLRFDVEFFTGRYSYYQVMGGWIIDNLVFRSSSTRYPVIGPVYEYVKKGNPLWLRGSRRIRQPDDGCEC